MMVLVKFIDLLRFDDGGNQNQQVGLSLRCGVCGVQLFVVVWWYFLVAFEEILQHLLHSKWKEIV